MSAVAKVTALRGGGVSLAAAADAFLLPDGSTRTQGPLFLSERRPVPARRPAAADICPHTGRARLGYDRARVLLEKYAGLDLHQLRHSAATHLGEAEVPLQLIMTLA
ncbi:hypothetical protein Misp01_20890 [Microtetraspora sp. NBRC 13810]|uniref:hypothetical protein n=1 Tax=Microtetraspora sp. NBRC 13810 TaxID=3030990 RepID=UPI0024A3FA18|nr:hypothetical protein [Microtetraspora sp. NBRC 13810]GLW06959.1 hypothetical protein Misp01_20890 [Microtetraspora sp. NBRC 13810]